MSPSNDVQGERRDLGLRLRSRGSACRAGADRLLALGFLLIAGAVPALADGRKPGSLLVFPIHRSGSNVFTSISVTNTSLQPPIGVTLGGATNAHFNYVNVLPTPGDAFKPLDCSIANRTEFLTPGDTLTRLTQCHNPGFSNEGYLVVVAEDPLLQPSAWSHNFLVGSEIVINPSGGSYGLNAIPFKSLQPSRTATDRDGDGQYDLDGIEYEGTPEDLIIDSFLAIDSTSLVLINATGGFDFNASVRFEIWNDNEFPLSSTLTFRCWFEQKLRKVSLVFDGVFLAKNTPNALDELDVDCDGLGDLETGWARIRGLQASSFAQSIPNPAILGAITPGNEKVLDTAKLLWESAERQTNGDFFKFGGFDSEFPE